MPDNHPINNHSAGIERLLEIMRRLRDPDAGCPWDIEQDFSTIAPYTIEEAYEVADAVERGSWKELEDELGDLLLQTVYFTQMGEEAGYFTFRSVVRNISDKMVARHPHVFGENPVEKTAEQQIRDWETIKAAERGTKDQNGTLDGVAKTLPALLRACKLQKRAARVGFDWPDASHVIGKIAEETQELVDARHQLSQDAMEEELGDLLFTIANLSRHLGVEPETALRRANEKFLHRFKAMETILARRGKRPEDSDINEMDALWEDVKNGKEQNRNEAAQNHH